jgi:ribosomal-protein-alanine N-acetyltransferase
MVAFFSVRSQHVLLRPIQTEDADPLFQCARDPEVTRYMMWPCPQTMEEMLKLLDEWMKNTQTPCEGGELNFSIIDLGQKKVAGVISLARLDTFNRSAEVGVWLGKLYWGTGLNRAAQAALAWIAFEKFGFHRLEYRVVVGNQRGRGSVEMLGLVLEGRLCECRRIKDKYCDEFIYRLLEHEWQELQWAPSELFEVEGMLPLDCRRSPAFLFSAS